MNLESSHNQKPHSMKKRDTGKSEVGGNISPIAHADH